MTISGWLCVWQTGKYKIHMYNYTHTYELAAINVSNCVWMYINKNEFLAGKRICHK